VKEPTIKKTASAFSLTCGVEVNIRATPDRIWTLLTDAEGFPRWNLVALERMTWAGGFAPLFKGVRTFELRAQNDGSTDFAMEERFSG
jgi:uncharacterized protein YndB with AHSA1/START domain